VKQISDFDDMDGSCLSRNFERGEGKAQTINGPEILKKRV